jgi:hypothetical protein
MRGAVVLCLALLAGCGRSVVRVPVEVPVTVYETQPIPAALLRECKVTLPALKSNGDLELALAQALVALKECEADKQAIRALP